MTFDPMPAVRDPARLAVLRATALLDSPPDPAFDRFTRLVARLLGTPVALVSLVDCDRQFFKSAVGLPEPLASARQTPLQYSFCKYVVARREPLIVSDARLHPLLKDSPAVSEMGVIAYAGMPLVVQGQAVGSLCAVDFKPREWGEGDVSILRDLAETVTTELELRFATEALRAHEEQIHDLVQHASDMIVSVSSDARILFANESVKDALGYGDEIIGHLAAEYVAPEYHAALSQAARRIEAEGFIKDFEAELVTKDGRRILTRGSGNCRYENGVPVSKRLVFRDITAQHRAEEEVALLERVTRVLAAAPDLDSALRVALEEMTRFAAWEYGDVWLPAADGCFEQRVAWYADPALEVFARESARMRFLPGEGAIGGVVVTREPVWLDLTTPSVHPRAQLASEGGGRGAMVLPLVAGEEVLGVFTFGGRDTRGPEQHRVNALRAVTAQIGPVVQRRKAEALALDIQARLQDFLDSINDLVMSVTPDGRISFVNKAWKKALGYTDEEVAQLRIDTILHAECRERCLQQFAGVLEGETLTGVEARFVARDGRVLVVEGSSNARFENGKPIATRSIFRDVTERRRAEEALGRNAKMLDSASEAIVIHTDAGITYWNRGAELLYGWTREEALGRDMTELLQTRFALPIEEVRARLQREGRWAGELVHTGKDGRQVVVESGWTLLPEDGQSPAVLEINSDVTERKRAQELFGAVLRAATESSIIAFHDTGLITAFNAGAERMLGYAAEEVVGKASPLLFHEPGELEARSNQLGVVPGVELFVARAREGEAETREWTYVRKDGRRVPVSETVTAMRDDHGNVTGFIAIAWDVSERKRVEQALRMAKQAAEDAARAKSEFLANMSHEIRTPMNGVLGMTELLLDTELSREQREYLEMVHGSAESLLQIINDILDFSRIEAGKMALDPHPFRLRDGFGDTLRTLAVRAREKGIELAYRVAPQVPDALVGDLGRLRQVLVNLVSNAIKFTERGEVVVEVSAELADSGSTLLHMSVRDSGIGIPLERQAAIFEAFTQADASTTRRFGGTGLGLSISAQLVSLMNGRIWVESVPGQGSTFRLVVPLQQDREPGQTRATTVPAEISALHVLVVDDNPTNRAILQELLGSWGVRCQAVPAGPLALGELKLQATTDPYHVVLLDALMPGMDGFAVAAAIRAEAALHGTIIMMLSSAADPRDAARCRESGIEHYLAKPVKQSDLFELLLEATAGRARYAPIATQAAPTAARSLRVLVAEDNPVNQRLARAILEKAGHAVTVAENGREAVELTAAQPFDVVLMDVQMPEMNGFEATSSIRARERRSGSHLPIVAVTAHAMRGDRERCLEAGMDDYVSKPLKAAELLALLEKIIPCATDAAIAPVKAAAPEAGQADPAEALRARMLEAVGGDAALLAELAGLFLTDARPLVSELREALAAGDAARIYRAAHRLKGSAGVFAAEELVEAAGVLEEMGRGGDISGAGAALDAVAVACDRLSAVLATLAPVPAS